MSCPSLGELPPPPPGHTGWPWTEDSSQALVRTPATYNWPRITVVTPSFNQGRFIEATIRSVLLQGYPNLEYFVLDGGSTDNTVEILQKYDSWIDFWVSEPDAGQSAAINRGLNSGSGLHATWINSDDMLCRDALRKQVFNHGLLPEVVYVGECFHIDVSGRTLFKHQGSVHTLEDIVRVRSVWRSGGSIDQPAVLFPLRLALQVGGLNEANYSTMDYELWGRFLLAGAEFHYTKIPFGFFRWHQEQKTADNIEQTESMLEVAAILTRTADSLSRDKKREILADLEAYREAYPKLVWNRSGRLAGLGLPPWIVTPIRRLRQTFQVSIASVWKPPDELR